MTRENTKKIRETLNGLIEHISNSCVVQDTNLFELSIQDSQCFSMLFKSLNLIWSDLHEEQIRPYQIRKKKN